MTYLKVPIYGILVNYWDDLIRDPIREYKTNSTIDIRIYSTFRKNMNFMTHMNFDSATNKNINSTIDMHIDSTIHKNMDFTIHMNFYSTINLNIGSTINGYMNLTVTYTIIHRSL